jgi:uncharacterized membrane protein
MRENRDSRSESGLGTGRIEALTDGVFAIAMTLLVLSIDVPRFPAASAGQELPRYLRYQLWPELNQYVLAFITLAAFWIGHHQQYHHIRQANSALLWLNILTLLLVALIPFSTAVAGDYPDVRIAVQIFELNLLLVGLAYYWHWSYATHNHRLVDPKLDPAHIAKTKKAMLVIPALSVVALGLSYISPAWSTSLYFLIPFLYHREKLKIWWGRAAGTKDLP